NSGLVFLTSRQFSWRRTGPAAAASQRMVRTIMASDQALVSARLPRTVRDRLRKFAASRGESVQQVVARAVSRLLADEAREPPVRQTVLLRLQAMEGDLRRDGVTALWMFGSVARDAAKPDSDIDLAVEFDPSSKASLLTVARLQQDIQSAL